jgi:hypothetical protein
VAIADPNGILPWKVRAGGRIVHLDMNTVAATLGGNTPVHHFITPLGKTMGQGVSGSVSFLVS